MRNRFLYIAITPFLLFAATGLAGNTASTLVLWEHEADPVQLVLEEAIRRFKRLHPRAQVVRVPKTKDEVMQEFPLAVEGNINVPDLIISTNDFPALYMKAGLLQPLPWLDTKPFFPEVVDSITAKQEVWGVPFTAGNHLMLYVNRRLIKQAPETLDELINTAQQLTDSKQGIYGLAYDVSEPFWFLSLIGSYRGSGVQGSRKLFASQALLSALSLAQRLTHVMGVVPANCDYMCSENLFLNAKAGMIINGDWALQRYREQLGNDLIVAPLPTNQDTGLPMAPLTSGHFLTFNSRLKGEHLALAKSFANVLTSYSVQLELIKRAKLPVLKRLANNPILKAQPYLAEALKALRSGASLPLSPNMPLVWDLLRPELAAITTGKTTPAKAVKNLEQHSQRL